MATMNISLPDAMKEWVEERVQEGQYGNSSDYVRDLIRQAQRTYAQEKLQQMVDEALASGIVEMTREQLMERAMSKAREALQAKKSA